jgi:hypothetical protein
MDAVCVEHIPQSVCWEVSIVIGWIHDDFDVFLQAIDRVELFSELSPNSVRHPLVVEQLELFRARYPCCSCHPVEYLRVRLAAARIMNGCSRFDNAEMLLRLLLIQARRFIDMQDSDVTEHDGVRRAMDSIEVCLKCAQKGVVYLF